MSVCPEKRAGPHPQSHGTIERPWGSEPSSESLTSSSASWRGACDARVCGNKAVLLMRHSLVHSMASDSARRETSVVLTQNVPGCEPRSARSCRVLPHGASTSAPKRLCLRTVGSTEGGAGGVDLVPRICSQHGRPRPKGRRAARPLAGNGGGLNGGCPPRRAHTRDAVERDRPDALTGGWREMREGGGASAAAPAQGVAAGARPRPAPPKHATGRVSLLRTGGKALWYVNVRAPRRGLPPDGLSRWIRFRVASSPGTPRVLWARRGSLGGAWCDGRASSAPRPAPALKPKSRGGGRREGPPVSPPRPCRLA